MGNQLAWMASNPIGVGITEAKTTGISAARNSIAEAAAVKALSGNLRYFQHSTQSLAEFSTQLLTLFSPSHCHCPFDSHFQFRSSCHCLGLRYTFFSSFPPFVIGIVIVFRCRCRCRSCSSSLIAKNCCNVACQLTSALFIVMPYYYYDDVPVPQLASIAH